MVAGEATLVVVFVSESFFFDFLAPVETLLAVGLLPQTTAVVVTVVEDDAAVGVIVVGCGDIF